MGGQRLPLTCSHGPPRPAQGLTFNSRSSANIRSLWMIFTVYRYSHLSFLQRGWSLQNLAGLWLLEAPESSLL